MDRGLVVLLIGTVLAIGLPLYWVEGRSTPRDVAWLAGAPVAADEATAYGRYLDRHRRHRLLGGLLGVTSAVVVGWRWYETVTLGIGLGSPLGDVLFCGLAGVIAGALSAETFRFSRVPSPHVVASLTAHRAARPPVAPTMVVARWLTGGALLVGALSLPGSGYPAISAVGGLVMVGIAEATRAAALRRRRPVLSDRARVVDARMRDFAVDTLANLELSAATLAAGWTLVKVPGRDDGVVGPLRVVVAVGALAIAVEYLRRARTAPPARFVTP